MRLASHLQQDDKRRIKFLGDKHGKGEVDICFARVLDERVPEGIFSDCAVSTSTPLSQRTKQKGGWVRSHQ